MKKILLLAVVMFASLNANAQFYVGGSIGFGSVGGGGNSEAVFTILPEVGYQLTDKWAIGCIMGYHKGDGAFADSSQTTENGMIVNLAEEFIINPYARYSALSWKNVTLFFDGNLKFTSVIDRGTRFGIGVAPGLAIALTDNISFVTHLGFVGFDSFSPKGGGSSSTSFGLDLKNNCSFGVYYNF